MSQAGQRLVDDHEDLHRLLEQLKQQLREANVDAARTTLDLFWARLAVHIRAEHLRLFPAVINAAERADHAATDYVSPQQAQSVVARLREDHNFFMHELALAISGKGDISSILKGVEERLASHNELEEKQIYAWITSVLSEEEQAQLAREIDQELIKRPPRFEASMWLGDVV
jgi:hemerythrin superfamily protein